jgi:hypothetical protein
MSNTLSKKSRKGSVPRVSLTIHSITIKPHIVAKTRYTILGNFFSTFRDFSKKVKNRTPKIANPKIRKNSFIFCIILLFAKILTEHYYLLFNLSM